MEKKYCDKCFKEIKIKDDYFEVITYIKGKKILKKFIHKVCHENINKQNKKQFEQTLKPVMNMAKKVFKDLGIEPTLHYKI